MKKGLLGVTAAQHGGERHDLVLAALALRRLLGVTLHADILDDVLALELLLHAAQRTVDRLILAHLDLNRHGKGSGWRCGKRARSHPLRPPSTAFFSPGRAPSPPAPRAVLTPAGE